MKRPLCVEPTFQGSVEVTKILGEARARQVKAVWFSESMQNAFTSNSSTAVATAATRTLDVVPEPARQRPRILHILPFSVRGGAEEHALSILAALRENGFDPWLAARPALLDQMTADLKRLEIGCVSIANPSLWAVSSAARFVGFLRRKRIAVVHSHMFPASMFASPLARLAGVRGVVETFHLREVWREQKLLKRHFWLDRQVARFVDRYIAVSHAAERHLVDNKGIARSKIAVIHNGRDLTRFHPPSPSERMKARAGLEIDGRHALLVLGRLEPQKGHLYLIAALRSLVPDYPRLLALFAGSGAMESDLRTKCRAAGLDKNVVFLGQRDDSDKLLAAADIVLLPSLYEGLPLVAIEALATERPMVASDIEGTREIVIDGDTGLLVPPADPAALAAGIRRLLESPRLAATLGARGRAFVERKFDVRKQIALTIRVYEEIIGERNR
jgi:glycosyltransferase involved in cell wall biosynthesis